MKNKTNYIAHLQEEEQTRCFTAQDMRLGPKPANSSYADALRK